MKYQVLVLMYLLFTQPFLAQNSLFWTVTDNSSEINTYSFQSEDTPPDVKYNVANIDSENLYDSLELSVYDPVGNFMQSFYFTDSFPENQTVIDQKSDKQHNQYILSCKHIQNQKIMFLEKYSVSNVLQWEFSIECIAGTVYNPKSINILEDGKVLIACYKENGLQGKESTLFYISSEGEFISEIAFK
jgi:hypothetical protein